MFTTVSRWILLNIIMSHGCLLDQRLATQSGLVLDRRQNIRLIAEKKKGRKWNEKCQDMLLRWVWAGRWCGSPFLLHFCWARSQETHVYPLWTPSSYSPPILVCMVSWSLFSLNPPSTEIRRGLLEHSTSLLPLMSVCVPPRLQLI